MGCYSSSDSSDEEAANICLMADESNHVECHVTDYTSSESSSSSSSESEYENESELEEIIIEIFDLNENSIIEFDYENEKVLILN